MIAMRRKTREIGRWQEGAGDDGVHFWETFDIWGARRQERRHVTGSDVSGCEMDDPQRSVRTLNIVSSLDPRQRLEEIYWLHHALLRAI